MSNTTEVTPYESAGSSFVTTVPVRQEDPVDAWLLAEAHAAAEQFRAEQMLNRLQHFVAPLHVRDAEALTSAAASLGYRLQPSPLKTATEQKAWLLESSKGERLAVTADRAGKLSVHSMVAKKRIDGLLRQHGVERTLAYSRRTGMNVTVRNMPNGEVELQACAKKMAGTEKSLRLSARIRSDGSVRLDVSGAEGSGCQEIAKAYAETLGGTVTDQQLKDEYFIHTGAASQVKVGG